MEEDSTHDHALTAAVRCLRRCGRFWTDGTTFTRLATTNWSIHLYQPAVFAIETEGGSKVEHMAPLPAPGGIKGDATADTTAVLLAAGAGTRLGRGPKALLPFRGRTLVEVLADVLLDGGCREVVVILGAGAEWVRKVPGLQPHSLVENPDWQTGMGSSFKLGLTTARPQDHVLVALVDQPGLTPETVGLLLKAHTPGRVTAAAYRNDSYSEGLCSGGTGAEGGPGNVRRGHPLLLDATLRAKAAASATGDAGARFFLQAHPELIDLVDCTPASGSGQSGGEDLDTPDQLHLLG
jgi:nicotine blue oxidoreductase